MPTSKRSLIILIIFLLGYVTILYFAVAVKQPLWHDEGHFIETIKYLAEDISLERLKHYNEMSTPLPFLAYALWGKITSFNLPDLRMFSLIIAFSTFLSFYFFFKDWYQDKKTTLLLLGFLIFQPYMIGITIFVYTDMLMMFFLGMSLISLQKEKPILFSLALAGGLLCRQYFIFWCLAILVYFIWIRYTTKDPSSLKMVFSTLLAMLPVVLLFIFWGGLSPENELQKHYISDGLSFHPGFIVFYICAIMIYLSPLIIIRRKQFYYNWKINIIAVILSVGYFLYPIRAAQAAEQVGVHTTGYFHRFIRWALSESTEDIVFYLIFLIALPVFIHLAIGLYQQWRLRRNERTLIADLAIFSFLITMSFSYVNWEKYLLPLIPLAILSIMGNKDGVIPGKEVNLKNDQSDRSV